MSYAGSRNPSKMSSSSKPMGWPLREGGGHMRVRHMVDQRPHRLYTSEIDAGVGPSCTDGKGDECTSWGSLPSSCGTPLPPVLASWWLPWAAALAVWSLGEVGAACKLSSLGWSRTSEVKWWLLLSSLTLKSACFFFFTEVQPLKMLFFLTPVFASIAFVEDAITKSSSDKTERC